MALFLRRLAPSPAWELPDPPSNKNCSELELIQYSFKLELEDTVGLIVWSAAEIAVTMICIGIPVCRPPLQTLPRQDDVPEQQRI